MKNLRRILIGSASLIFSAVVLMQCTSQESNQDKTQNVSGNESSYVNLYDGRVAFPDSVHKSWQDGNLEDVRKSVLTYIDGMIDGVESEILKYEENKDTEKLNIAKEKLERVKNLKMKIEEVKDKTELRNLMHQEFRSGDYKDKFGSGK